MFEKRLARIAPRLFISDGTIDGKVTVDSVDLFRVKQSIILTASTLPNLELEVKRVISDTELFVGPKTGNIDSRSDISKYTVALGASIQANEQLRPKVPEQEITRHTYEEEPVVARRVVMVNKLGEIFDEGNPLPIAFDGTVSVGNVTIQDDDGHELEINTDGSINVNVINTCNPDGLKFIYGESLNVASGIETTIATINSSVIDTRVLKIDVSGENIALFKAKVNGAVIFSKRTSFTNFNEVFSFEDYTGGLLLKVGDSLQVTVIHTRPTLGNFEATISVK